MAGAPAWRQICSAANKVTGFTVRGENIYLLTHDGASRYKIVRTTAAEPGYAKAKVVVPESKSVIRGLAAAKDGVYIQDLNAGLGGLRRLGEDGTVTTIALPFAGSIDGLYADTLHDGAWFLLQGWVRPSVLCMGRTGSWSKPLSAPKPLIDVSPYTSERCSPVHPSSVRSALDRLQEGAAPRRLRPLLLDAYGAYGITEDAGDFLARWLPLLDMGGVFAVARSGGGELGEDWHLAASCRSPTPGTT